jgi:lysophospholipid acyltransferase (LPLAT)-like uncharacterized protein
MSRTRRHQLAGGALQLLLGGLLRSTRYEVHGAEYYQRLYEADRPCIFVLWHGRLLPLGYLHRGEGVVSLISRSNDGDLLAGMLGRWGFVPVRGSSSRGGTAALREVLGHARAGRSIAITPDGPRGPRQRLKPGVLVAAQLTGLPLVPVAAGASRGWWFGGWDRFLVPQPFSRIRVAYGEPVEVPRELGPEAQAEYMRRVEDELNRLTNWVDRDDRAG